MARITVGRLANHLAGVPALILAGGLGSRLRAAVPHTPKVLAPIHGRPFLSRLLDQLADASLRRVVLLTGHQADAVEKTIGVRCGPLRIEYSREQSPLGTGGAIRQALERIQEQTILLLNGDSYCHVDLAAFHAGHRRSRADLSIVTVRVNDASRFGQVRCVGDGTVVGFEEKSQVAQPGWINAGIYLIQRHLLAALPTGESSSLERDWLPRWTRTNKVMGFASPGPFLDIGTPESYVAAEAFFASSARHVVQRQAAG